MSTPTDHLQRIIEEGRYAISGILGSGGMGIVYLARDRVLGREVALKVLREPYVRSEEFMERFRREANNAAALSHPNIISVYDRSEPEDGPPYIAMEYVSGGTLTELISREAPLPPGEAARIALGVANALNEAHRRGLIHRDIKSGNILLTEEGRVKVADFGIARAAEATALTHPGQVFGTVSYVSPEQAAGGEVGPESDLYSLGILLYEMLTGEVPFEADSPIGVAVKHVREEPVPVGQKNPEVPEELAALTMALLSKDPASRPSPASQVAARLERFLRRDPIDAPASAASASVSALAAGAGSGAATQAMERVASAGAMFWRGRRAALLCAVVALPIAGLFVLMLYDRDAQNTNRAFTPVLIPDVSGVKSPAEAVPTAKDAPKVEAVVPKEHSSSPVRGSEEKQSGSSPEPSGPEASTVTAQATSTTSSATPSASATASASATSSATASATTRPAARVSTAPTTPQPVAQSPAGSATEPAASSPRVQAPPQPERAPRPVAAPKPAPAPRPQPSNPAGSMIPDVNIPEVPDQPEIPGSGPSTSGSVPGESNFSGGGSVRLGP